MDFAPASVLDFKFSTSLDNVPTTLGGTPAVSVYKDNSTTQSTTGVTLSVDFDGLTGLHNLRVDTADAFYASGSSFQAIITTGTVGGNSVVGLVIAQFSLDRGRVGSIKDAALTASAIAADAITNAKIADDAIAVENIKDGAIDAATFAAGAINAAAIAADAITATKIAADAITAAKIADGAIDAATFAANAITSTVLADNAITAAKIAADAITAAKVADGAIDAATFAAGAITATAIATGAIDADAVAADAANEIADALLGRNINGGSSSGRLVKDALKPMRNKVDTSSGVTMDVYEEDDTTLAWQLPITPNAAAVPIETIG